MDFAKTEIYHPPETIWNKASSSELMTVWSLGLVLYELVYKKAVSAPWQVVALGGPDSTEIKIPNVSKPIQKLLKGMLDSNPATRYTINQVASVLSRIEMRK